MILTPQTSGSGNHSWVSSRFFMKKEIILTLFLGAQKEFVVTDKYMKKQTIQNWGKPCIWLNN